VCAEILDLVPELLQEALEILLQGIPRVVRADRQPHV
jgi:hypothetical protein